MLTKRQKNLLLELKHQKQTTIKQLAEHCHSSEKTIQMELVVITSFLHDHMLGTILTKRGKGIFIYLDEEKEECFDQLIETEDDHHLSFLIHKIFMRRNDKPITETALTNLLYTSRKHIHHLMEELSDLCKPYGITIYTKQKYGIQVEGQERQIRDFLISYFMEQSDYPFGHIRSSKILDDAQDKQFQVLFQQFQKEPLERIILAIESSSNVYLDHISRLNIFLHLCLVIIRSQLGYEVSLEQPVTIHHTTNDLFQKIQETYHLYCPDNEKAYAQLYLESYGLLDTKAYQQSKAELQSSDQFQNFTSQFIEIFNAILSIDIEKDVEIQSGLFSHLAGTIMRLKNGIRIHNPLLYEVKESFSTIYQATWATSLLFDQYFAVSINEDEVAYIALYLGVVREKTDYTLHVCLLCHHQDTAIHLLVEQIKKLHSAICIDQVLTSKQFETEKEHRTWDLVISTLDKSLLDQPCVQIKKIMKEHDRLYLLSILQHILDKKVLINEKSNLHRTHHYFDKELIFLSCTCSTKQELLEVLCKKLYQKQYTEKEFLSSVLKREHEISTEIGSSVAIPHGNATYVKKSVIVYANLTQAIAWNKEDTVKHVFLPAISSSNKKEVEDSIKRFYRKLIQLIENKQIDAFNCLKDPNDLISAFEER